MDSEEVLILGVDTDTECLCLGRNKVDKGKQAANPTKRRQKKSAKNTNQSLVILDDSAEAEDDYIEMYSAAEADTSSAVIGKRSKKRARSNLDDTADGHVKVQALDIPAVQAADNDLGLGLEKTCTNGLIGTHDEELSINLIQEHLQSDAAERISAPTLNDATVSSTTGKPNISHSVVQCDGLDCLPVDGRITWPISLYKSTKEPALQDDKTATNIASDSSKSISEKTSLGSNSTKQRTPTCWTNCPNCPPNKRRKYHLIDVAYNSAEWSVVSTPLVNVGFVVNRVQRIQNDELWQRLCYEKQLMLRERFDVNEQLLYHTTRSTVAVICDEGLDLRLSMNGNFGCGIYFSDNPIKCNNYWSGDASRYMFCCRVLLGEVKTYPKGKCEKLKREPKKMYSMPGEPKFYDSVMGNLSGHNEFVVYNAYRVMPEYVLHYVAHNTNSNHVHVNFSPGNLSTAIRILSHPISVSSPKNPSKRKKGPCRKKK